MERQSIRSVARTLGLALAVFIGATTAAEVRAEVVVIANAGISPNTLALDDLRLMYLGKKSRWPDKTAVQPAVMKSGETHKSFVTELLERTPSKFSSYWKQILFTGRGIPPKAFCEEEELVAYVRETPGAIGYVSPGAPTEGVQSLVLQ